MTEEKSVLDAAVEAMVDIYTRLEDAANGIWAVALELSQLNEKLGKLCLQLLSPYKIAAAIKRQRHQRRRGAEG